MPDTNVKSEDPTVQIAHLRDQVEALMKDRVTPAVTDMAGRAENAMNSAAGMVRDQAQTISGHVRDQAQVISGHVRDQPLIAVLLAAGIGYLLGRTTR
jgi:ElaB/YqjD/DUF883 family membrane-anchored ribosome-binding protein